MRRFSKRKRLGCSERKWYTRSQQKSGIPLIRGKLSIKKCPPAVPDQAGLQPKPPQNGTALRRSIDSPPPGNGSATAQGRLWAWAYLPVAPAETAKCDVTGSRTARREHLPDQ